MTNKTIMVDLSVHKQITDFQKEVKKLKGYELQIKDIVAKAVSQYVKNEKSKMILEFPKKE